MNWTLVTGACALSTVIIASVGVWAWKHPSSRETLLRSDRYAAIVASIVCFPIYLSLVALLIASWLSLQLSNPQVMAISLGITVCITPGSLLLTRVPGISRRSGHIGFTVSLAEVIVFVVLFPGFLAHHFIARCIDKTSR